MLEQHAAHDRAVRYAVRTGRMPNMYLIHRLQDMDGYEPCFGRCESPCTRTHCRWHEQCMALASFSPKSVTETLPAASRAVLKGVTNLVVAKSST